MKKMKFLFKLLVSLLIFLTLFNFIGSTSLNMNYSFAATSEENVSSMLGAAVGINGIAGAAVNFFKWIVLAPFRAVRSIICSFASAGGTAAGFNPSGDITPYDIFFNKFVEFFLKLITIKEIGLKHNFFINLKI